MLTRTEPAIHNPNVDGFIMISPTLRRSRVTGASAPVRVAPGLLASMVFLTLFGWGQHIAPSASASPGTVATATHSGAAETTSKPLFAVLAALSAGSASFSQSASSQPEAMTPTALLAPPIWRTAPSAEGNPPQPDHERAGSGVSVIWLVPLGFGIIVLGVLFVVTMYRHRHDDRD